MNQPTPGLDGIIAKLDKTIKNMEQTNEKYQITQHRPVGSSLGNSETSRRSVNCVLRESPHGYSGYPVCDGSHRSCSHSRSSCGSSPPEACQHHDYEWQEIEQAYLDEISIETHAFCMDCGEVVDGLAIELETTDEFMYDD